MAKSFRVFLSRFTLRGRQVLRVATGGRPRGQARERDRQKAATDRQWRKKFSSISDTRQSFLLARFPLTFFP
jgi:hypothetical protein